MMPEMGCHGMLVAGDAAALCLAAGIWLEGVELRDGLAAWYAGEAADEAIGRGDVSRGRPRPATARRLERHLRARRTTASCAARRDLVLSAIGCNSGTRRMVADVAERMFRVDNPIAEAGPAPHPPRGAQAPGRCRACATSPATA